MSPFRDAVEQASIPLSLEKIAKSCPRIKHLELSHRPGCTSSEQFSQRLLKLLQSLKDLKSLSLNCTCLNEDVIVFLVTHPGLQVLDGRRGLRFQTDRVTAAMKRVTPAQSFPSLRVLNMHLDKKSIPLLLANATTLRDLELTDVSPQAFATVGKLRGLTNLTLTLNKRESATLAYRHLHELQFLSNLRALSVRSSIPHIFGIQNIEQTITALASGLPRLEELELPIYNIFSGKLLETIGTECPLLHDLRIVNCMLSQADLENGQNPLFRQLKTFEVTTLYVKDQNGRMIWGARSVGDPVNQSTTMFDHIPEYFQNLNETEDRPYGSSIIEHPLVTEVLAQSIVDNFPSLRRFNMSSSCNGPTLTRIFEELKGLVSLAPQDLPRRSSIYDDEDYMPKWKYDE